MSEQDPYFVGPGVGQPPPVPAWTPPPTPAWTPAPPAPPSAPPRSSTLLLLGVVAGLGLLAVMVTFFLVLNTGAKKAANAVDKAFDIQARLAIDQLVRAEEVYRAQRDTYAELADLQPLTGFTAPPGVSVALVSVTPTRFCASARYAQSDTTFFYDSAAGSVVANQPCQ